jgi:hypothetical protein
MRTTLASELRRLLLVVCAIAVAAGPASAALKPGAFASNSGGGVVSVSGGPWDRWRLVVETKPTGLPVLLAIGGDRKLVANSPIVRGSRCRPRCLVKVTAQLWTPRGNPPARGTVSLALSSE